MKQLTCEMCGSNDLIKQDGVFVCQSCGCKYSVEEAKKMMIEGTVEVKGTVKIDSTSDIPTLYKLARNEKGLNNYKKAIEYYERILIIKPNEWEAQLYSVILKISNKKYYEAEELRNAVNIFESTILAVLNAVKNDESIENTKEVLQQIVDEYLTLFGKLVYSMCENEEELKKIINKHDGNNTNYSDITHDAFITQQTKAKAYYLLGDSLEEIFGEEIGRDLSTKCWVKTIEFSSDFLSFHYSALCDNDKNILLDQLKQYTEKVKIYNPDYISPSIEPNGCYVATCVYGSYDCPQVWTLRRYRDYTLAETWYGRAFIRTYYAISPTIVRWFGNTDLFKKFWRSKLDRMVKNLMANGIEDTPYYDKDWR